MSPVGVGIVGTGQRSMFFFGPHIKANADRARLVALADQDETRLHSAADDLGGGLRLYGSLDAMLKDPEVDVVIITTPDATHRQMFDKALAARKHILCEKPMATTIQDAVDMTRRALASPQVVQIGFMLRYAPFVVKLKEVVDSGVIGSLIQVNGIEIVEYYHGAAFFRRWHRFRRNSGGLLVHKASHTLDVINWMVGAAPIQVSAQGGLDTFSSNPQAASRCRDCSFTSTCPAAYRIEDYNWIYQSREERENLAEHANDLCVYNAAKDIADNAVLLADYRNGVRLTFNFTTTGQRHERVFMFIGQRGQIHASQSDGIIRIYPRDRQPETLVLPEAFRGEHGGGDTLLVDSFLDCVASGNRPTADVLSGLYSVALAAAATTSMEQGGGVIDLRPFLEGFGW